MKVEEARYSIAEIIDWLRSRKLTANKEYQRGSGLWPSSAKSYFIDTILRDYPFPKVYFHERLHPVSHAPMREIVDGQQRLATIVDFADGKFSLGRNAGDLEGVKFSDLDSEQLDRFFGYTVAVDVIRNADRTEILQMFRRMNAFTLPLNAAEKRHSMFFGNFSDWINTILDRYGAILTDWNVFTSRQALRMIDAEFVADLALAVENGIVNTTPTALDKLYKKNNDHFAKRDSFDAKIAGALDVVVGSLSELQETALTRNHLFHSLICALIHNRSGLPNAENATGCAPIGSYFSNAEAAIAGLKALASAYEEGTPTNFSEFAEAASKGGNRATQRTIRVKWLCLALQGKLAS